MFWTYNMGMLQNLECLLQKRIHSMLGMFGLRGPESVEFPQAELRSFLDCTVKKQKFTHSGSVYRLPKH